jgi:hypothetical protein
VSGGFRAPAGLLVAQSALGSWFRNPAQNDFHLRSLCTQVQALPPEISRVVGEPLRYHLAPQRSAPRPDAAQAAPGALACEP